MRKSFTNWCEQWGNGFANCLLIQAAQFVTAFAFPLWQFCKLFAEHMLKLSDVVVEGFTLFF